MIVAEGINKVLEKSKELLKITIKLVL